MGVRSWFSDTFGRTTVEEATAPAMPVKTPTRSGFEFGIGPAGLNEYNQSVGQSTQTDRRSLLQQLYEAYLACPWSWAAVNAIARTITAGGLVTDWDADDGEGDQEVPPKPANVLALERLFAYTNPDKDIRQVMRTVITDLLVFGDAFIEVVWVGDLPVALYNLDSPTMAPLADEHGQITGYVQNTEFGQRAEFDVRDVVHIALDSPRSGVFGISPTQAALLPITSWLFTASTGKEIFRKGVPPTLHADMPPGMAPAEMNRWKSMFMQQNVGPRNIGTPIITKGGAKITELAQSKVADLEAYKNQLRDEILACYGVPPAKAMVIESGNLGGGTGESQDKTFRVNTCQPIAEIVLEKINFHIVRQGFGIEGWHVKFSDIDMRDSKTIEEIRDLRLRNGSWTLNKYRTEIGEPPTEGGDDAVLVDRQNLVKWADMDSMSKAGIAMKLKGTALEPSEPLPGQPVQVEKPAPAPVPAALAPFAGQPPPQDNPPGAADSGEPPPQDDGAETMRALYRQRLREALDRAA
jgi:HK97 family phage portal protein